MVLCLLIQSSLIFGYSEIGINFDLSGDHTVSLEGTTVATTETSVGGSISFTHFIPMEGMFFGFGAEIQKPRDFSKDFEGTISFLPIYAALRFPINETVFIDLKGGYAMFGADVLYKGTSQLSGGFMYSFGAAIKLDKNVFFKGSYDVNNGSIEVSGYDYYSGNFYNIEADIEYKRLRFGLAVTF
jgi:hypothetical protein